MTTPSVPAQPSNEHSQGVLQGKLDRARTIWRLSEVLVRGLLWMGVGLGALLILFVLDNLFTLPSVLRLLLGAGLMVGGIGFLVAWVLKPFSWKISDQAAAVYVERKLNDKENLLVNAVQLGKDSPASRGVSQEMIGCVLSEAAQRAIGLNLDGLWEKRRIRNLMFGAGVALALILGYFLLLPSYAQNAFMRYAKPLSGVPPLSQTRVEVYPSGDVEVLAGEKLIVHGLAWAEKGSRPSEAFLVAEGDGAVRRLAMQHSSEPSPELVKKAVPNAVMSGFVFEANNITKPFSFTLACNDGRSLPVHVKVREKPRVEDLSAEITPPAYTGRAPNKESLSGGLLRGLNGSVAKLSFVSSKELSSATLQTPSETLALKKNAAGRWEGSFAIDKDGTLQIGVVAADGVKVPALWDGRVLPLADGLPTVGFEAANLNQFAAPGTTLPLVIRAQDDIGLKYLKLVCAKQDANGNSQTIEASVRELKTWNYPAPGSANANEVLPLVLSPDKFAPGDIFIFAAEVNDYFPDGKHTVRSAPLVVRILTPDQMAAPKDSGLESVFKRIQALVEMQIKVRGKTATMREFAEDIVKQNLWDKRQKATADAQRDTNVTARRIVMDYEGKEKDPAKGKFAEVVKVLNELLAGPMGEALAALEKIKPEKEIKATQTALQVPETKQTEAINRLLALLGHLNTPDAKKEEQSVAKLDSPDGQRLRDKLEDEKEKVKEFIEAQKKILKATEELEQKKPEDLTEDDKKKLAELAREENDWAKYFKEKFTDFSKLPDQDFSNSKMASEFNEVYQEVKKAAEALNQKNTELAVPTEQAGLEAAKKLETNIEKWLPDTRDSTKWVMEEPQGKFDVPLADLPEEMEDLIGELIDDEKKMTDDVQDVSASFLDSMDKGVGWGASDGPIANMSAKGVTGNQLPNNQEIGGRSGEGRSGKSSGQFVEKTADGKGGPQTPTRLTQDPFEAGQVDDKSKDPVGGSTGGGKSAGAAGEGLRGTPKPPDPNNSKLPRLQETQLHLRQEAEKIVTKLQAYHLPSSDMEEAVRRMKQVETAIVNKKGGDLRQAHSAALDELKKAKTTMDYTAQVYKERSRDLPENVRHGILSGMQQKPPEGYQDLLEAYYKALVEHGE